MEAFLSSALCLFIIFDIEKYFERYQVKVSAKYSIRFFSFFFFVFEQVNISCDVTFLQKQLIL